ncbi:Fosmidomycin resistance protein [Paracoccus haematequi]|uniref:Fosmidomycin resistance protein n=1 Tax=Paracoccus haematequi TaxID=2491866 RepID=A0A447IIL1_9RHOB|nr:MFS transporter [Paracoccus haematequi]VDS07310.1 Fosmidomycin resistance protein [Paracoccus haematequi]
MRADIPTSGPMAATGTAWGILTAISLCHMINDVMQSMLAAIYPLLQVEFSLTYAQIGVMTFAFQVTASLLQPLIGMATDKHPQPRSLPFGMAATFCGVLLLAFAHRYEMLLTGAMLIGVGSAVFHPESSRVARLASGGRFGTAQSLFQMGGNFGQSLGPLLAAFIVVPLGRPAVAWFAVAAALGSAMLWHVGGWAEGRRRAATARADTMLRYPRDLVIRSIAVLAVLTFTKNIYTASMSSYFTFFTIEKFGLGPQGAQMMLFLFLGGMAAGVILGGIVGDRIGPLRVIWFSILGVLPFTLLLPHVGLVATGVLAVIVGLILASAFPAIVVFAQELVPGRTGTIAGLFFGFSFGMGGIAAAALGVLADAQGIETVFLLCSFLPILGILTIFLPRPGRLIGG